MNKDTQRYLKVKFEHEELEEIIANNPIINEWRMAYVEKVVPPTEEEVCEVLSEHNNGEKVFYENGEFYVVGNSWKVNITKVYKTNGKLYIAFCDDIFPPHIIAMLGRFYEREEL